MNKPTNWKEYLLLAAVLSAHLTDQSVHIVRSSLFMNTSGYSIQFNSIKKKKNHPTSGSFVVVMVGL